MSSEGKCEAAGIRPFKLKYPVSIFFRAKCLVVGKSSQGAVMWKVQ